MFTSKALRRCMSSQGCLSREVVFLVIPGQKDGPDKPKKKPKDKYTREQAERFENLDPLRGQWTTGQIVLKLGGTSAKTLKEAAGEYMLDERDWEEQAERSRYDKYLEEKGRGAGAEAADED
ncbi:hypothetical protein NDU88_002674 [Pleurodeles waltl]|uniref:Uncharacterized protein n=1 Tax=Pleurodeles waltl TaxID=8319 RepID=A0AAV7M2A9_PLEWA|nr:hypothetical protein NDU88_002674 [Pleurodeles waltl]